MIHPDDFSKLTTALYSAAMGSSDWSLFLDELTKQSGGVCTHMFGFDIEAQISMGLTASGYDPSFIESYNAHYGERNAWAPGFSKHDAGIFVDCEDMCPSEDLVHTEFYNDWLKPQEQISTGGGVLLFKSESRVFLLGGNIRSKDEERLKGKWANFVRLLTPHMQQAFEVSRALAGAQLETMMATTYRFGEIPGIIILTAEGRIVHANSRAGAMLAAGHPIGFDLRGRLRLSDGQPPIEVFRRKIQQSATSAFVEMPGERKGQTYELRLAGITPELCPSLSFIQALGISRDCSVLLISEKVTSPDMAAILQGKFGLTRAEADVALHLAQGMSARDIADHRQVSIHTVRYQIKAILGKVGVRRQAELVQHIGELSAAAYLK